MSKRVVTRLSAAQYAVFRQLMDNRQIKDEADMLRLALEHYAVDYDWVDWPHDDPKHGGARNSQKVKK